MRSGPVRWLAVVFLVPLMMVGALGGVRLLGHAHDGHGFHVHAADTEARAIVSAAAHRLGHAHGVCAMNRGHAEHGRAAFHPPVDGDAGETDGVLILIPDDDQLPARAFAWTGDPTPPAVFAPAGTWAPAAPDPDRPIGRPGGPPGPLDLRGLCAGDRLVRTSRALRI